MIVNVEAAGCAATAISAPTTAPAYPLRRNRSAALVPCLLRLLSTSYTMQSTGYISRKRKIMKKKVLIVDDDQALAGALRRSIVASAPQYDITVETDSRNAVSTALKFRPDLVLMDVIMPWMDGATVVAEMRKDVLLQDTPVIYLTSIIGKQEQESHHGLIGHDPVLAKPVNTEELLALMAAALTG